MFDYIWFTFLYQPLFNALIWIYANLSGLNLGWAVVWLTVFLRLLMLPLTIISERNAIKHEAAEQEALQALRSYKGDPIAQKEEFRRIIKKNKISPWAKVVTLLIQVLVLVLLYQVFMRGITGEKIFKILYPFLDFPGKINLDFYGFDIGASHDSIWAGIVAIYLFFSIYLEGRDRKWDKSQMYYLLVFPLFTFFILWLLPMVKSLFILTSMLFSDIVTMARKMIFPLKK